MPVTMKALLAQSLKLSERNRELLALEIWRSLDGVTQAQAAEAWAKEINRRMRALERGTGRTVPVDAAIRDLRRRLKRVRRERP